MLPSGSQPSKYTLSLIADNLKIAKYMQINWSDQYILVYD